MDMAVLEDAEVQKLQFGYWSLAYAGVDALVDQKLAPTIYGPASQARDRSIRSLRLLLTAMVEANAWR